MEPAKSGGSWETSFEKASNPPADAPTPIIGNDNGATWSSSVGVFMLGAKTGGGLYRSNHYPALFI